MLLQVPVRNTIQEASLSNRSMSLKVYHTPRHCTEIYDTLGQEFTTLKKLSRQQSFVTTIRINSGNTMFMLWSNLPACWMMLCLAANSFFCCSPRCHQTSLIEMTEGAVFFHAGQSLSERSLKPIVKSVKTQVINCFCSIIIHQLI